MIASGKQGNVDVVLAHIAAPLIDAGLRLVAKVKAGVEAENFDGLTSRELLGCGGPLRHMVEMLADLHHMKDLFVQHKWKDRCMLLIRNAGDDCAEQGREEDRAALRGLADAVSGPYTEILKMLQDQLTASACEPGPGSDHGQRRRIPSTPASMNFSDIAVMDKLEAVLVWAAVPSGADPTTAPRPLHANREQMERIGTLTNQPEIPAEIWPQICASVGADPTLGLSPSQFFDAIGRDAMRLQELLDMIMVVTAARGQDLSNPWAGGDVSCE